VLDTVQNFYLAILWVLLSITCLILLNRFWAPSRRRVHNDVIGWQISILGTIYAVMVGFMLYAVWSNFQSAEGNADNGTREATRDRLNPLVLRGAGMSNGLAAPRVHTGSVGPAWKHLLLRHAVPPSATLGGHTTPGTVAD